MKNTVSILKWVFIGCLALAVAGGCKTVLKKNDLKEIVLPADFKGHRDSMSAAETKYADFFSDRKLVALIDTAMQFNADYLVAMQKVEAARARMPAYNGALFPNLNLGITASGQQFGKYTMDGTGNSQTTGLPGPVVPDYSAAFSSSWEIDIWGKLKNRKKAARYRLLSTEAGKNFIATNLIADVAYHYYTLAALDEESEIIRRNIQLQEMALEIVKLQKEGGRATELAVKQFAAQLANTQSLEYRVKLDIARTENELNFLLGRYPVPIKRDKMSIDAAERVVASGVPSQLLSRRPDIVQAELELKASAADVAAARADFLPAFNISAAAGLNSFSTASLFDPASLAFNALGSLVGPVLNRSAIRANYNASVSEQKGAYYQYSKTIMNAVYEVTTALESIENMKAEYTFNLKAATALNEAVAISNDLFVGGYANYLEIIIAQKDAVDAELEVIQSKKKLLFGVVNLYRSLGGK